MHDPSGILNIQIFFIVLLNFQNGDFTLHVLNKREVGAQPKHQGQLTKHIMH